MIRHFSPSQDVNYPGTLPEGELVDLYRRSDIFVNLSYDEKTDLASKEFAEEIEKWSNNAEIVIFAEELGGGGEELIPRAFDIQVISYTISIAIWAGGVIGTVFLGEVTKDGYKSLKSSLMRLLRKLRGKKKFQVQLDKSSAYSGPAFIFDQGMSGYEIDRAIDQARSIVKREFSKRTTNWFGNYHYNKSKRSWVRGKID